MGKEEVTFPIQKDELESIFNNLESKVKSNIINTSFNDKHLSKVIRVKTINMTKVKKAKNLFSSKLKNMINKKFGILNLPLIEYSNLG